MDEGLFSYRYPVKVFIATEPYRTAGGSDYLTMGRRRPEPKLCHGTVFTGETWKGGQADPVIPGDQPATIYS